MRLTKKLFLTRLYIILLVMLNVGCDQISKEIVRKKVDSKDFIELIDNHFILTNIENKGAMLGFGANFSPLVKRLFLQGLPLIVLLILLYRTLTKTDLNKWILVAFTFVIGGGIGNLMDRIMYGSVTDFFQIRLGFFRTGIFNMADVSVTLGVLLILGLSMFGKRFSI